MAQEETSENITDNAESKVSEPETVKELKQALDEEKAKADKYLANWQRSEADLINYRKRVEQEREETIKFANADLVMSMLPVLDDMERAFASIPHTLAKQDWVNGFKMIERKLRSALEAYGVSEIKAEGEPFDPRFHEAVRYGKGKEGMVVEVIRKGYKLNDRVIRPAMVVVGGVEGVEEAEEKKEE